MKITSQQKNINLAYIYLAIKVGSMHEHKHQEGLSHFVEHCIFAGTNHLPNENAVWENAESIGGSINAFTSKDHTMVFCRLLPEYLDRGLMLLSELALHPRFDNKDIKKEHKILEAEILRNTSNKPAQALRKLVEQLFPDHPVAQNILGTDNNIKTFTREKIKEYHQKFYTPSNMVLSVTSNIDSNTIDKSAQKFFPENSAIVSSELPKYKRLEQINESSVKSDDDQSIVMIGFRTENSNHIDAPLIQMVSFALGQMATFGLRGLIRFQEGMAYSVTSSWNSYISGSYALVMIKCQKKNVKRIIDLTKQFITALTTELLNKETLDRIIASYLGLHYSDRDNPDSITKTAAYCTAYNADSLLHADKVIKNITTTDFLKVAQEYFSNYEILKIIP